MTDFLVGLAIVAAVLLLGWGIVSGKMGRTKSGFAPLTAFHDFAPKDKQEAIEIVVEKQAGKKWSAQESGQGGGPKAH